MLAATLVACRAASSPPELTLYDLEGAAVDPFADRGKDAVAFLFTRTDCPISNRYSPELERLHEAFAPRGIAFFRVYLDADEKAEAIRSHGEEFGHRIPALHDPEHRLVAATGATVTPEAVVYEPGGRMLYRAGSTTAGPGSERPGHRPPPTTCATSSTRSPPASG